MATKIIHKKSNTVGAVPLSTDLEIGELGLNLANRKIYTKNNIGVVVSLGSPFVGSVAPGSPNSGDLWYDTSSNFLKFFNGSAWVITGFTSLSQYQVYASSDELNILDGATLTTTELNYVDGVTSAIQTQLDGKSSTTHNHSLNSLSNVTITSNTPGELLAWSGSAWINNTLFEAGIQPAGSYLTAEADTLQTVTDRGATTTTAVSITDTTTSTTAATGALIVSGGVGIGENLNVTGNAVITGNLTVIGTTTTVNSTIVEIGDNIIILNAHETGSPTQNAGFEVERGTAANVQFIWNETTDSWDFGSYPISNVVIDGGTY
jgi:hypothetical protein